MEVSERKKKKRRRVFGPIIVVASITLFIILFVVPYGIHLIYQQPGSMSFYSDEEGDMLTYWGSVIGGMITVIGPIALSIVALRQNDALMEQNERLVNLEASDATPVIKTNLYGLYRVETTPQDNTSFNFGDVKTLYSTEEDVPFGKIFQHQSFVLVNDRRQERDLMIIQVKNLSNYPITKVKAYMDVADITGKETKKESIRLMNFAPSEIQLWGISVPRGELDHLNAYVKIIEFEFYSYKDVSLKMTLFYLYSQTAYGRSYNVELLLNDSYSDSDLNGVID